MCIRKECGDINATGPWCQVCERHITWQQYEQHSGKDAPHPK